MREYIEYRVSSIVFELDTRYTIRDTEQMVEHGAYK